jgi:aminoglycoside 6'-N-acetyltransferase
MTDEPDTRTDRPALQGERLTLRPARPGDAEPLAEIVAEPEVARWFGRYDIARVRRELLGAYVIVVDGAVAGWLGVEEETDPEYRHVGFDIMLGRAFQGHGYGGEALRLAIRHFAEHGHHRFTIDPAVANERAIRAYARVGFKPVGVMRAYERTGDEPWHDNLLMDLLAAELDG